MTLALALALYFIIWWLVLFAVLPFGVRSQAETGEVAEGTEPGAPATPLLVRKMLATTLIAAAILGLVFVLARVIEL